MEYSVSFVAVPLSEISKLISKPDTTSGIKLTLTASCWFSSIKGAEKLIFILGAVSLSVMSIVKFPSMALLGEFGSKINCSGPSKLKSSTICISTVEDKLPAGMII